MRRVVVGLDPGSGISSPTGFAAFDPDTRNILHVQDVTASGDQRTRIRSIASDVATLLVAIDPDVELYVFCESFVMRGRAGETLARLTGALMAAVPPHATFAFVHNTTVKLLVAGSGRADKNEVAVGVDKWFASLGPTLIMALAPDITDALAIGIAGWQRHLESAAPTDPTQSLTSPARPRKRSKPRSKTSTNSRKALPTNKRS